MTGCFIDSGLDHDIFLNSDISQGSVVTQLRCREIISQGFVANLLMNLSVKELWKSVNIWRSYGQYRSALFFWLTVYNVPAQETAKHRAKFGWGTSSRGCSDEAKTWNPLKFAWVTQTHQWISTVSRPKFTILQENVEEILWFNQFLSDCRYMP